MLEYRGMIRQNINELLAELPEGVQLEAAVKARNTAEILAAVAAGVKILGENYVQEAETVYQAVGSEVEWHLIGHLQKNKVKKAVRLFDMVETVDSVKLACEIDKRCAEIGKVMPVLIEINSGREWSKAGVFPENAPGMVRDIAGLENVKIVGLMTMGPTSGSSEELRSCFSETKQLFESTKQLNIPGTEMKYLSMGMSDSYRIALDTGANIVRIGSKIFGNSPN
ncbi:YggS family pyridoxal phosphate-dependent enzyme [Chloroflexota bacterium]